jgi:hypothetical protein
VTVADLLRVDARLRSAVSRADPLDQIVVTHFETFRAEAACFREEKAQP